MGQTSATIAKSFSGPNRGIDFRVKVYDNIDEKDDLMEFACIDSNKRLTGGAWSSTLTTDGRFHRLYYKISSIRMKTSESNKLDNREYLCLSLTTPKRLSLSHSRPVGGATGGRSGSTSATHSTLLSAF